MTHRIRDGGSGEVPLTFLYSLGSSLLNNILSNRQTGRCRCLPVRGHDLEHLRPFREQTQKIGPGCAWRAVSEGVSGTLRPAACGQAACGGLGRSPTHTRVRAPGRAWRSWPPWSRAWEGPARCRRTCSPSACTCSPSTGTCSPSAQPVRETGAFSRLQVDTDAQEAHGENPRGPRRWRGNPAEFAGKGSDREQNLNGRLNNITLTAQKQNR